MKRALKVLTDREVSPQLGLLKSTLLQLDSTFSERDYGVSTFRDFIEKVAKTGLVTLRHSGRSMMVDAVEAQDGAGGRRDALAAAGAAGRSSAPAEVALAAAAHANRGGPGGAGRRSRAGAADCRIDARRVQSRDAAAALADVRPPAQAVHPRSGSDVRRAQVGFRDGDGVPARVSARGALPARARSARADSRVPGCCAAERADRHGVPLRLRRSSGREEIYEAEPVESRERTGDDAEYRLRQCPAPAGPRGCRTAWPPRSTAT